MSIILTAIRDTFGVAGTVALGTGLVLLLVVCVVAFLVFLDRRGR